MSIALTAGYPGKICNNFEKTDHFLKQSRLVANENELLPTTARDKHTSNSWFGRCSQLRETK